MFYDKFKLYWTAITITYTVYFLLGARGGWKKANKKNYCIIYYNLTHHIIKAISPCALDRLLRKMKILLIFLATFHDQQKHKDCYNREKENKKTHKITTHNWWKNSINAEKILYIIMGIFMSRQYGGKLNKMYVVISGVKHKMYKREILLIKQHQFK